MSGCRRRAGRYGCTVARISWPSTRANVSVGPPAAKGTFKAIERSGNPLMRVQSARILPALLGRWLMAKLPGLRTIASASAFSLRQCPRAARIFGARRFARDQAPGGSGSLRRLLVVDEAGQELSVIAQAHCGIILVSPSRRSGHEGT